MRTVRVLLLMLVALLAMDRAQAHATSTSYLVITAADGRDLRLTWDIAVVDLHWALGLDGSTMPVASRRARGDGDGSITWAEIEAHRGEIAAFIAPHLEMARGGGACEARLEDMLLAAHSDVPHLSLAFSVTCSNQGALTLRANLFFDSDSTQRTLIDVSTPGGQFTSILSPHSPEWAEPPAPSKFATFATFVWQGMWHVWIGYDHLAFLVLLLLPAVLRGTVSGWQGTLDFRATATDLVRIVTAFTLAHSLTLTLAATGTVRLPVRPIEIAIAASIVIAGVLNLFPRAARARLALAFGFGLVHGFGFANALAELGTNGLRLVPTLAGFNVGVELAQLALVVLVLPLLFGARNSTFYARRFMPAASLVAAMAGAAWLAARIG